MKHKLSNVPYVTCQNCGEETIRMIHLKICKHCKQIYTKKSDSNKK
ncbi:hypothetical protein ACQUY5_26855 [Bacillus cereus]